MELLSALKRNKPKQSKKAFPFINEHVKQVRCNQNHIHRAFRNMTEVSLYFKR